jgi:hypothetical protein
MSSIHFVGWKEVAEMSGLSGGGGSRIDVLIGTGLVMAALISVVLVAGTNFGHTPRINQNLTAPQLTSVNEPEWMRSGPRLPR